ncbi:hypothetical protein [Bacillus cereus]|uniref:hypothetical protein n=1 Tax=Bacillus cereus TaxID=1396 RepID=UPI000BFE3A87|nr:hypothetical protein [Bacillus cereus]PGW22242.1 hypothetical protein COD88_28130 [Bacillus cereus]
MNIEEKKKWIAEKYKEENMKLLKSDIFADLIKLFSDLGKQYSQLLKEALKPLQNIDLQGLEKEWKEAAESLARKGWTIPMNMDIEEIFELSQIEDKAVIDSSFQTFYSKEKEFQFIKTNILEYELINGWKELLEQCFENYEKGNYLIVIPNLFIIIENISNILISPRYQKYLNHNKRTSLRTKYKKVQQDIDSNSVYIIFYVSVAEFLSEAFAFGDFDNNPIRLPMINRDWVLHGRDDPKNWKQVDALRLFNALQTIVELDFLLKDLEKEAADVELVK